MAEREGERTPSDPKAAETLLASRSRKLPTVISGRPRHFPKVVKRLLTGCPGSPNLTLVGRFSPMCSILGPMLAK